MSENTARGLTIITVQTKMMSNTDGWYVGGVMGEGKASLTV